MGDWGKMSVKAQLQWESDRPEGKYNYLCIISLQKQRCPGGKSKLSYEINRNFFYQDGYIFVLFNQWGNKRSL